MPYYKDINGKIIEERMGLVTALTVGLLFKVPAATTAFNKGVTENGIDPSVLDDVSDAVIDVAEYIAKRVYSRADAE